MTKVRTYTHGNYFRRFFTYLTEILIPKVKKFLSKAKRVWMRFRVYFLFGIVSEAVRLTFYHLAERVFNPNAANLASLPFGILASFLIHGFITWKDRPGNRWGKLGRFTLSQLIVWGPKAIIFPYWRRISIQIWIISLPFSCPFYEITHNIVDLMAIVIPPAGPFFHELFTCGWMSVSFMDLCISGTLGYFAHDKFSFWKFRSLAEARFLIKARLNAMGFNKLYLPLWIAWIINETVVFISLRLEPYSLIWLSTIVTSIIATTAVMCLLTRRNMWGNPSRPPLLISVATFSAMVSLFFSAYHPIL